MKGEEERGERKARFIAVKERGEGGERRILKEKGEGRGG